MEGVPIKILGRGHLNDFIMVNLFFIDIQKEEIPEFLIQGKDQEGFEERYISDFIGNFSMDNIFKTASI